MKTVTYIVSIFLMTLILINSIRVSLTYAYFEIDPVGFVEYLCENTAKPELQCNGKCQLKKVAKSQNNKKNTPENITDFKELVLIVNTFEAFVFQQKECIKKQTPTDYHNLYSFTNTNDCFHPPQV